MFKHKFQPRIKCFDIRLTQVCLHMVAIHFGLTLCQVMHLYMCSKILTCVPSYNIVVVVWSGFVGNYDCRSSSVRERVTKRHDISSPFRPTTPETKQLSRRHVNKNILLFCCSSCVYNYYSTGSQ